MAATDTRPAPAKSLTQIRRMGYEGERQRQITNGWYMRGRNLPGGGWAPEAGLPGDVLVLLPMGAPYEREMYPDKGFKPLSEVPNKKAIAGRSADFSIIPPKLEVLRVALEALKAERPKAIAALDEELAEVKAALADPGGLMKGEAAELRKVKRSLDRRREAIGDDRIYEAEPIYRQMVAERQEVLRAQMSPQAVRQAELEREHKGWELTLSELEGRAATDSTSAPTVTSKSTRTSAESRES